MNDEKITSVENKAIPSTSGVNQEVDNKKIENNLEEKNLEVNKIRTINKEEIEKDTAPQKSSKTNLLKKNVKKSFKDNKKNNLRNVRKNIIVKPLPKRVSANYNQEEIDRLNILKIDIEKSLNDQKYDFEQKLEEIKSCIFYTKNVLVSNSVLSEKEIESNIRLIRNKFEGDKLTDIEEVFKNICKNTKNNINGHYKVAKRKILEGKIDGNSCLEEAEYAMKEELQYGIACINKIPISDLEKIKDSLFKIENKALSGKDIKESSKAFTKPVEYKNFSPPNEYSKENVENSRREYLQNNAAIRLFYAIGDKINCFFLRRNIRSITNTLLIDDLSEEKKIKKLLYQFNNFLSRARKINSQDKLRREIISCIDKIIKKEELDGRIVNTSIAEKNLYYARSYIYLDEKDNSTKNLKFLLELADDRLQMKRINNLYLSYVPDYPASGSITKTEESVWSKIIFNARLKLVETLRKSENKLKNDVTNSEEFVYKISEEDNEFKKLKSKEQEKKRRNALCNILLLTQTDPKPIYINEEKDIVDTKVNKFLSHQENDYIKTARIEKNKDIKDAVDIECEYLTHPKELQIKEINQEFLIPLNDKKSFISSSYKITIPIQELYINSQELFDKIYKKPSKISIKNKIEYCFDKIES